MLTDEELETARLAIENVLVEMRDNRMSLFGQGNGLVIREQDGKDSSIIRLSIPNALRIGLNAVEEHRRTNPAEESA
jgi:hypothetical protein